MTAPRAHVTVNLLLNHAPVTWRGDPDTLLLDWLRDDLGITSVKRGCSPQAGCGSCTVRVDDEAQLACSFKMRRAEGRHVRTLEGLEEAVRAAIGRAIARHGGAQCGFCSPGIAMRAATLLAVEPAPDRARIAEALTPHICRCTGWVKVLDAIESAAAILGGEAPLAEALLAEASLAKAPLAEAPGPGAGEGVGARRQKRDARDLALGERAFVADLSAQDMLHGALVLSEFARAEVRALDVTAALALPGVARVLTAADFGQDLRVGLKVRDWPTLVAIGSTTRYVGDCLAIVVASERRIARRAAALVAVDYRPLAAVVDPEAALLAEAPALHEGGNLLSRTVIERGDVAAALAGATHVVAHRYQTQRVEHAFLEPETCLAVPHADGGLEVFSQGQGVYEDRRQLAALLGWPEARLRVHQVAAGGAFGGKEDLSVQGQACLAAVATGRPVRIELSRDESIRLHPKRHPMVMDWRLGCDAAGRLLGLQARIVGDGGAYASVSAEVLARAASHATGGYHVPAVAIEALAVYTNNPPCGAFRGFGVNQVHFAMECAVDELCELGGFDRWQLRWDNALHTGSSTVVDQVLSGPVGLRDCLEAVQPAFRAAPRAGLALGMKNVGVGGAGDLGCCRLRVGAAGRITIQHGFSEMGQGLQTVAAQILSELLGDVADFQAEHVVVEVNTAHNLAVGMTTASRATSLLGSAIIDAAAQLRQALGDAPLRTLAGRDWVGTWRPPVGSAEGEHHHYGYGWAAQVVVVDAQGQVERVVAAHDAGRVINPMLFEAQIEGAVHMGLGYALTEALPCDAAGWPWSTRIADCGVLPASQMPAVTVIAVENPDPNGPMGARGIGEIGLVPTAPAVANALWAADGVRRYALPMGTFRRKPRKRARV